MRIIGGQLKGKKILEPKDKNTRPLKDMVRESIFNILIHSNKFSINLKKSKILDLFCGVGSFGLEAISRGANFVVFVENYLSVIEILKKNINDLGLKQKCEIINQDILNKIDFNNIDKNFDLVFLDPPFKEKKINSLLDKINQSNILKINSMVILHRHTKEKDIFPNFIKILEEKSYGNSKIFFMNFLKK